MADLVLDISFHTNIEYGSMIETLWVQELILMKCMCDCWFIVVQVNTFSLFEILLFFPLQRIEYQVLTN